MAENDDHGLVSTSDQMDCIAYMQCIAYRYIDCLGSQGLMFRIHSMIANLILFLATHLRSMLDT